VIAIRAEGIHKGFKRHPHRRHFLTLKSTMIRDIWRRRQPEELFWALKGVDLEVPRGATVGIIGSNGSGKSTLLKIIAGILKPTRGRVEVNGRLSALIELGAGFHPEISGRENIYINGIMLGLSRREVMERFDQIVDFSELREFIDNPVKTYSSGMYMRLGFSVAIHVDPDILIIDEVLAVGDQAFVFKCLDRIDDFRRRGKTILMVTHNLAAVEKLCDTAVWLREGELVDQGRPRRVIDAYLLSVTRQEEEQMASQHEAIQAALERIETPPETEAKTVDEIRDAEPEEQQKRWGNRDIEIQRVEILDLEGNERYVFQSGEGLRLRIHFTAHKRIEDPVFGVGIHHSSGIWCYGSNTDIERIRIPELEGPGWLELTFERLDLIEGSYFIDIAAHALDGFPYDYLSHLYSIAVRSNIKDFGVYRPPHHWTFAPEIRVEQSGVKQSGEVDACGARE
jgi:ABC-type polysaccharide/polyol phosphate transport system ATPase subunit